jgi:hypothetical protein
VSTDAVLSVAAGATLAGLWLLLGCSLHLRASGVYVWMCMEICCSKDVMHGCNRHLPY